jgi:hypothetical protein
MIPATDNPSGNNHTGEGSGADNLDSHWLDFFGVSQLAIMLRLRLNRRRHPLLILRKVLD